jgi:hypothetical protein
MRHPRDSPELIQNNGSPYATGMGGPSDKKRLFFIQRINTYLDKGKFLANQKPTLLYIKKSPF